MRAVGRVVKKKIAEKDLSGSQILPIGLLRANYLCGNQRDVVAITRVMGQMDLDSCARGRGRAKRRGTGEQRGEGWRRRKGGGEISRLQASAVLEP